MFATPVFDPRRGPRHEFGHVVTLLARSVSAPHFLEEGIADYIEQDGRPIRSYFRFDDLRDFVRNGQWNGDIEQAEKFIATDRYGQDRMFAFADRALRSVHLLDYAQQDLGETWPAVKQACASYIRAAVR